MRSNILASLSNFLRSRIFRSILIFGLVLVLLTAGIRNALGDNALGADFFTFWKAGNAVFIQQESPYSDAVVQETQLGRYHRLALPGEDQLAFVYPPFMLFLVYPFVFLDFPTAQALWLAIHLILLVSITFLAFSSKPLWPALSVPFFYPLSFSLILGNFNLTIGLIFYLFFWAYFTKKLRQPAVQAIMGIGLAFSAGKPQFIYLLLIIACLILLKNRLWRGLAWFFGALFALFGLSFLLLPGWLPEWVSRARIYTTYTGNDSVFKAVFGFIENRQILTVMNVVLLVGMLSWLVVATVRWLRLPRVESIPPDDPAVLSPANQPVLRILALASLTTYVFHPFGKSYEQIVILVPFFLWAATFLRSHPVPVQLFWWAGLAVSWITFFIARFGGYPWALYTLPVVFFIIWLIYLWTTTSSTRKEAGHAPA